MLAVAAIDWLVQCTSVIVQSTHSLTAVDVAEDSRFKALEVLRALPSELQAEPPQDELAAFVVAARYMSLGGAHDGTSLGSGMTQTTQISGCMAAYTLGCRCGAEACASPA